MPNLTICQFHYDWPLKSFKDVKLLFEDTDSLVHDIKASNVKSICYWDKYLFDFSGYPHTDWRVFLSFETILIKKLLKTSATV